MSHNQERTSSKRRDSGINGRQDLGDRDTDSMSPKPSYPSKEPDSKILRGYCGGKKANRPISMSTLGQGPSPRKNSSSAMENPPRMDIAEGKGGNI